MACFDQEETIAYLSILHLSQLKYPQQILGGMETVIAPIMYQDYQVSCIRIYTNSRPVSKRCASDRLPNREQGNRVCIGQFLSNPILILCKKLVGLRLKTIDMFLALRT